MQHLLHGSPSANHMSHCASKTAAVLQANQFHVQPEQVSIAQAVLTPVHVHSQANAKENANRKTHMTACHSAKQDKVRLCEALRPSRAEPDRNHAPKGVNSAQHSTAQQLT